MKPFKLVFDSETTGLNPYAGDRPFAFAFMSMEGQSLYYRFDVDPFTRKVLYEQKPKEYADLKKLFACPGLELIGHNIGFDLTMVEFAGLPFKGKFWDTKILAHVADSSRMTFALKPLTKAMFGYPDEDLTDLKDSVKKARRLGKKLGWKLAEDVEADYAFGDPELCKKYAIGDVERTLKLYKAYESLLEPQDDHSPYSHYKAVVEMEHALLPIAMEMSRLGVAIDMEKVLELEAYYRECIKKADEEKAALGYADLNPESPQQVIKVFYGDLKLDPQYRKRKAKDGTKSLTKSADKRILDRWSKDVPLAKCLVELSEAQHQLNSFILPFKENSFSEQGNRVLHPSFNTCGPVTGRLSCSAPNLQNVTASTSPGRRSSVEFRARECFVPRQGKTWVLIDYSQIEIVVAAYLSKDSLMLQTLESGNSVHDITCDSLFSHKSDFKTNRPTYRKMAKIVGFSMLYGSGPKALSELLGIDESEAKDYWQTYWDTYRGIARYNEALKRQIRLDGWVKDLFGRPYFVEQKFAYKALNYMVQGTAAGIMKRAIINADTFLRENGAGRLLLTVHDELCFEIPNERLTADVVEGLKKAMQGNFHTLIGKKEPFGVEVSLAKANWGKKESFNA